MVDNESSVPRPSGGESGGPEPPSLPEVVRLEYEQVNETIRMLTDVRFKLLAFVPAVSGFAVALLTRSAVSHATVPGSVVAAASTLGFFVTLGIVFYDQRNSNLYDGLIRRANEIESTFNEYGGRGKGLWSSRPPARLYLLGVVRVWHDRGLALIYASVLGGWLFAFTTGIVISGWPRPGGFGGWQVWVAAGVGVAGFTLFFFELTLLNTRDGKMWLGALLRKRHMKKDALNLLDKASLKPIATPFPEDPKYDLAWTMGKSLGRAIALVVPMPRQGQEDQLRFALDRIRLLRRRVENRLRRHLTGIGGETPPKPHICAFLIIDKKPADEWFHYVSERDVEMVAMSDLSTAVGRWEKGEHVCRPES